MTVEQLDKISAQRLEDVDIDTLVEVNSIKYADGMPVEKKVAGMKLFILCIKNLMTGCQSGPIIWKRAK